MVRHNRRTFLSTHYGTDNRRALLQEFPQTADKPHLPEAGTKLFLPNDGTTIIMRVRSGKTEFAYCGAFRKRRRPGERRGEQVLLEKRKKSRRKKLLIWLGVDLAVAGLVILLLLHKPSGYHPVVPAAGDPNGTEVNPYLSRDLSSQLYNGAQRQRPFEMVVRDEALNQAIVQLQWPRESGGVTLSAPQVRFTTGRIILMGTVKVEGADVVLTITFGPRLDDQGKLNLLVEEFKVGAIPLTPLAKMMARKMYKERLESVNVDMEDLRTKIAASLFNEEPFEPILKVEDKWIRLQGLTLTDGKLTAQFIPAKPRSKR
jgi:hypothetical protein